MSALLDKIRSRSHWRVVIRPGSFDEKRVADMCSLLHILENTYVRFGYPPIAWPFPHIDSSEPFTKGIDWVGQEKESELWEIADLWRFYQSGQFIGFTSRTPDRDKSQPLDSRSLIVRFSEIFEFASRLSRTDAGDAWMHMEITMSRINPVLKVGSSLFKLSDHAKRERKYREDVSTLDLVANSRELALKPALELFECFGWNPGIKYLRDLQDGLLPRQSGSLR